MAVGRCFDITKGLTTNGARQRKSRKLVSRRDAENSEKKKEIKPSASPRLRVSAWEEKEGQARNILFV
jgi:hypothetical protein